MLKICVRWGKNINFLFPFWNWKIHVFDIQKKKRKKNWFQKPPMYFCVSVKGTSIKKYQQMWTRHPKTTTFYTPFPQRHLRRSAHSNSCCNHNHHHATKNIYEYPLFNPKHENVKEQQQWTHCVVVIVALVLSSCCCCYCWSVFCFMLLLLWYITYHYTPLGGALLGRCDCS